MVVQSINQSGFYHFMSVYSKMLSDRKGDSAGLCTIDLAMEVIASVLYKISSAFILLRAVRSYPSFLNSAVLIEDTQAVRGRLVRSS